MKRIVALVAVLVLVATGVTFVLVRQRTARSAPDHAKTGVPHIARNLVLITIDTLRADHVGAYGYEAGTTPSLDRIARSGVRFSHAYAPAPVTLASHASMLTGRYPPGHGARDNGMRVTPGIPTLATVLREAGFETAAFIAAFPLDRRFGLSAGFDAYSDRMPRGPAGKLLNERPGREVVDEARAWLDPRVGRGTRLFVWVHLFEPHAPYGDPANAGGRTTIERYDDDIRTADEQVGRLLDGLGTALADTLVVAVGDHGEAFGEHGEISHSLFVYDTTLRVPWVMRGPGIRPRATPIDDPVCLIDLAPTVLALLQKGKIDSDGLDLSAVLAGGHLAERDLYAESFAPLFDFGWSPLRSVRRGRWKAIAAPRPELYDLAGDSGETRDVGDEQQERRRALVQRADAYSPAELASQAALLAATDREAAARLRALGYLHGTTPVQAAGHRPDPKDRRELAARMGMVVAGELRGEELKNALETILREDPRNPQAHLRLGDCLLDAGAFAAAAPHFAAAIAADLPSVDAQVGLAACQVASGRTASAEQTLQEARQREPGNPVVLANLGILQAKAGRLQAAIQSLTRALEVDPDLHEARFNLALAYADSGRRQDAERQATDLLARLPATAPQRPEVARLLATLRR